jgi:tRNA(Ile)-lysidine synthase
LGAAPDFAATEALHTLALAGRAGQKCELEGLRAERTHRELRLAAALPVAAGEGAAERVLEYLLPIPGEIAAPVFGLRLRAELSPAEGQLPASGRSARLRNWIPGDRVRLRHSGGPRKVKEVLERLRVTGTGRALWPVLELDGRIVWMRGVELEPEPGIAIIATPLDAGGAESSPAGTSGAE